MDIFDRILILAGVLLLVAIAGLAFLFIAIGVAALS